MTRNSDPKYALMPPSRFVGKSVKRSFDAVHPVKGLPAREQMWVEVDAVVGGKLVGRLNNHPVWETGLEWGDRVEVEMDSIIDAHDSDGNPVVEADVKNAVGAA